MSNLIVTIIAIALVAVAALMAAYYGAESWNRGTEQAKATTLINQKVQIKGAAEVYKAKGHGKALNINELKTANLLNDIPEFENASWQSSNDKVFVEFETGTDNATALEICWKAYSSENPSAIESSYAIPSCATIGTTDVCCYAD